MATQLKKISKAIQNFIEAQKMFFVATAANEGRVNLSPKGIDSFRVLGPNKIIWMNLTGSGNETAAHLLQHNRMTIMFCSFEEQPLILRLYGKAISHHVNDSFFQKHISLFSNTNGARQIFEMDVEMVQTSCGFAVPFMDFKAERTQLTNWAAQKEETDFKAYWKEKNTKSIDGFDTEILK